MLCPATLELIQSKIRSLDETVQDSDDSLDSLTSIKNENASISLIDLAGIQNRFEQLKNSTGATPIFTVRSGTDPSVLQLLSKLGAHFNCISKSELKLLQRILGAEIKNRVTFSNPAKSRPIIQLAGKAGVRRFTVGSVDDVKRVTAGVPNAVFVLEIDSNCQDKVLAYGASSRDQIFAILEKLNSLALKLGGISIESSSEGNLKLAEYATEIADQFQLTNAKPSLMMKTLPESLELTNSNLFLEATNYLTKTCRIEALQIASVAYKNDFGDHLGYTLHNTPKIELTCAINTLKDSSDLVTCEIRNSDGEIIFDVLKRFQRLDVGDWIFFSSDSCTNLSRNFLYVQ